MYYNEFAHMFKPTKDSNVVTSKAVWPGTATFTHCRQTQGTVRNRYRATKTTWQHEDNLSYASYAIRILFLFIAKLGRTQLKRTLSTVQQN